VVQPLDAADVAAAVRFASTKKAAGEDVSVTARSAGTDMSGGPLNSSIILDMTGMNRLVELGQSYAVVEPGMYFRDFDKETKKKKLELPSYTASREINTVGGMAANNSGGEKNLKYGKTARYVEQLDVVLSDGQVHTLKNLKGDTLVQKLAEQSFEGDLYRAVAKLVRENKQTIADAAPKVEKNSSGYALWDIGDGEKSLNLARLMVGAQGTLGIITTIRYGLVHPEPYSSMVVLFVKNLHDLGALVPEVLKHSPDSFESYDNHVIALTAKYFPELAGQMGVGFIGVSLAFLPEVWMALSGGIPTIVLLVEFRDETQAAALEKAQALFRDLATLGLHEKMHIAANERAARKYWIMRRETFNLLRKKVRGMRTAPFIDDFVVPPLSLPEFLPKLNAILSQYHFTYAISGHVGDGNFHIFPLIDPKDPGAPAMIEEVSKKVYDLVLSYHGSISGEHNDGLVRTPYVEQMFGEKMYALFKEVKKIFDPLGIFNPGKKVGLTSAEAFSHLDLRKS
jgi:FAD/FMN-containing dehydrogenase